MHAIQKLLEHWRPILFINFIPCVPLPRPELMPIGHPIFFNLNKEPSVGPEIRIDDLLDQTADLCSPIPAVRTMYLSSGAFFHARDNCLGHSKNPAKVLDPFTATQPIAPGLR